MRRVVLPTLELTANQLDGTDPLVGGPGCVTWHSVYETSGAATASYRLTDGPPGANQELMYVTLAAGGAARDYIGLHALPFVAGLYFVKETGALAGSFHAYVDHDCELWLETAHLADMMLDAAVAQMVPAAR